MIGTGLLLGAVLAMTAAADYVPRDCTAWLDRTQEPGVVQIEAYGQCAEQGEIDYRLTTISAGSSGKSTSSQQGKKLLTPGSPKRLAQIRLGTSKAPSYTVTLEIYRDGVLAAQASSKETGRDDRSEVPTLKR